MPAREPLNPPAHSDASTNAHTAESAAPVQPAAVIDKVIVDRRKHIDIELSQLERHQALAALVCLVKINARALRNLIPSGPLALENAPFPRFTSRTLCDFAVLL